MAIGFWLLVATIIMVSGLILVVTSAGYRVLLLGCVMLGLTPLGFVEGPDIPVFLSELLLVVLALGIFANCYKQLPGIRVSGFLLVFCGFFVLQIVFAMIRGEVTLVDLVRDIRPIAFVGLLLLLVEVLRQASVSMHVTERAIAAVVIVCVFADVIFYAAAHFGLLSIGGISGEYYARTGLIRYADLMTISLFGLANYLMYAQNCSH